MTYIKVPTVEAIRILADRAESDPRTMRVAFHRPSSTFATIIWEDPRSLHVLVLNGREPRLVDASELDRVPAALIDAMMEGQS